jgi:putative glycosyltransferase (TIGR04372 family)
MVEKLNKRLPGTKYHTVPAYDALPVFNKPYKGLETLRCILKYKESFLTFTSQEEKVGREMLHKIGIPEGKPFICFHCRDAAYLDAVEPGMNWRYHDYRDSNIHNYLPAIEKIVDQNGYYALRMGAIVKEKIRTKNPLIIDYASNGQRTDFLDIYLGAKCRFFVCSDTGISMIPEVFRVPVVYANWALLSRISTFVLHGLVIPKKVYSKKEGRILTFPEIIRSEISTCGFGNRLEELGVQLIENTPEEIMAVTVEMEERLKGTWKTTEEDEELQQRFWKLFGPDQLRSPNLRMGADYLRQNQMLLNCEQTSGLK